MSITGEPGRGPMRVGIPIADLSGGLFCALGILVALLEREQSGKGQEVASSLLQAQIFMLDFQGARWLNEARCRARPATTIRPASRPACSRPRTATSISRPPAARCGSACAARSAPKRCSSIPTTRHASDRSKNRNALNVEIERYLADGTSAEWVERISAAEVPCGPIYAMDEVFADPQVQHLDRADIETSDERGTLHLLNQPVKLSARRAGWSPPRPSAASTPRRCCASSASARPTSPSCARPK